MKITRGQILTAILCLAPLAFMLIAALTNSLSANPIQDLTQRTGRTAVILLVLSLACTPLKNLLGLSALIPMRKTLGIFAFAYAALHFLIFSGLDFEFNLDWILAEIQQKPFIRIGLVALGLLLPLAFTSFKRIQSSMGRWWQRLHRLVYPITMLAIWHYYLASKGDIQLSLIYTAIFTIFMLFRLPPLSKISISNKPHWLRGLNQFLLR